MEYNPSRKTIVLQGPAEISPVLKVIGDVLGGGWDVGADEEVELPLDEVCLAIPRLHDSSWERGVSEEDGAVLRGLADELGVLIVCAAGCEGVPLPIIEQPTQ